MTQAVRHKINPDIFRVILFMPLRNHWLDLLVDLTHGPIPVGDASVWNRRRTHWASKIA
jgi:hypothetical protein